MYTILPHPKHRPKGGRKKKTLPHLTLRVCVCVAFKDSWLNGSVGTYLTQIE